jgi:nitrogen-specific signal transduction histidine kinase
MNPVIISIVSIVVSSVTAIFLVFLNRKQSERLKRIEAKIKKEELFLNKLISLKEAIAEPISKMQGDIQALAFMLEHKSKELDSDKLRTLIDTCSDRIGFISNEYEKGKYLFTTDEKENLDKQREVYQSFVLKNDVISAFIESVKFHNSLLEIIDLKINTAI